MEVTDFLQVSVALFPRKKPPVIVDIGGWGSKLAWALWRIESLPLLEI
jgi:hypothetical protein